MGVKALQAICLYPANVSVVYDAGGFDVLLSAMVTCPVEVLVIGAQMVQRISSECIFGESNRAIECKIDQAIVAMTYSLRTYTANSTLVERICSTMTDLLSINSSRASFVASSGGISAVASVLDVHARHATVIHAACGTLAELLRVRADDVDDTLERITCVSSLVSVIRANNDDVIVLKQLCGVLCSLAASSVLCIRSMMELGVIPLICSLLHTHRNCYGDEIGFSLLHNLAVYDDNCCSMVKLGVVPLIINALQGCTVLQVKVLGCVLLSKLSTRDHCKHVILETGGVPAILHVIKEHGGRCGGEIPAVIEPTCHALYNLASNSSDGESRIVSAGGIRLMLALLEAHSDSANIAAFAICVLSTLTSTYDSDSTHTAL